MKTLSRMEALMWLVRQRLHNPNITCITQVSGRDIYVLNITSIKEEPQNTGNKSNQRSAHHINITEVKINPGNP